MVSEVPKQGDVVVDTRASRGFHSERLGVLTDVYENGGMSVVFADGSCATGFFGDSLRLRTPAANVPVARAMRDSIQRWVRARSVRSALKKAGVVAKESA